MSGLKSDLRVYSGVKREIVENGSNPNSRRRNPEIHEVIDVTRVTAGFGQPSYRPCVHTSLLSTISVFVI